MINKENIFIRNAKAIQEICENKHVDIGVAANIWCADNGIHIADVLDPYEEYRRACLEYTLNKIVKMIE